jgi:magnesium transporter
VSAGVRQEPPRRGGAAPPAAGLPAPPPPPGRPAGASEATTDPSTLPARPFARFAWWRWARAHAEGRTLLRTTGRLLGVTPPRHRARLVERSGGEVGRAPGEVAGQPDAPPAVITVFRYDGHEIYEECEATTPAEAAALRDAPGVTWINVDRISDASTIRQLGEAFGLHPLVQEDLSKPTQRPKLEPYGEQLFVVVKMVRPGEGTAAEGYADGRCDHIVEQVGFILGPGYLLSFQEDALGDVFEPIRERLRHRSGRFREQGPDYLLYALLDVIVDHYFVTLERVGDATERYEDTVFSDPSPSLLKAIQALRREVVVLRRIIWPLREVLSGLQREDTVLVTDRTRLYLRDVYDHLIQAVDTVETLRDVLDGLVDHYLSAVSYRTNEVMRVLTVVGTIFLPLTLVTSCYGMNFDPDASVWNMPELRSPYGYPAILGLMVAFAVGILVYFRRRRWL